MAKLLAGPREPEPSLSPIYHLDQLPAAERDRLERLAGPRARVRAVVDSDLLTTGHFGRSCLVLTDREIFVAENDAAARRVPLDEVASAICRDFVGNGLLELRTRAGRRLELIRYSKTMSDSFQQIAERINRTLEVSDDALAAQEQEAAKTSGPREARPAFRCPNCGHPLLFATDVCPKCTSTRLVMMRLMSSMTGHWPLAVWGLLLSVAFTVANLGPGYLVKQLVDTALGPEKAAGSPMATREARLLIIVGAFFVLVAIRMVTTHLRIRVMGTLGERVVNDLRARLYRTLQRLSLSYYDREHTGRIMARVLSDTRSVQRFVVQGLQEMIIDSLMVVGIAAVLVSMNWRLAALALLPVPVVVWVGRHFSGRFRQIFRSVRRRFATLSAAVSDTITGMRVVKSFAQEQREIEAFNAKLRDCYDAHMAAVRTKAKFNPAVAFMMSVGVLVVWLVGGEQVLGGTLTLGTLLMFITYMQQFYNPIQQLLNLTEAFQESATAAERVFSIMDMPSDVADHDDARELDRVEGRLELQNVSFRYEESDLVLKDIDLTIEPGEMVGLVGQTGSGKSTLVSLICRFYDPQKGRILLDGADLRDIQARSLRSRIGMVLQDSFLFAGTIRDNIAYGRPEAGEEDIIRSARAANAHDFIMSLPDGYDSEVGERGVMLSGGEKQRISIARAILKDPPILVLDEATSAVDTATEAAIQEAMDRLVHGRTTIAIAHRLSTLRNANRIVVLEDGAIIEQGTHEELMQSDGVYANLVKIQSSFASDIVPD